MARGAASAKAKISSRIASKRTTSIGSRRNKSEPLQFTNLSATREEVEQAFRALIKSLQCPECGLEFTDAACEWSDAWREGRRDVLAEEGTTERDGPCKIKCELCGCRSFVDYFAKTVQRATDS